MGRFDTASDICSESARLSWLSLSAAVGISLFAEPLPNPPPVYSPNLEGVIFEQAAEFRANIPTIAKGIGCISLGSAAVMIISCVISMIPSNVDDSKFRARSKTE